MAAPASNRIRQLAGSNGSRAEPVRQQIRKRHRPQRSRFVRAVDEKGSRIVAKLQQCLKAHPAWRGPVYGCHGDLIYAPASEHCHPGDSAALGTQSEAIRHVLDVASDMHEPLFVSERRAHAIAAVGRVCELASPDSRLRQVVHSVPSLAWPDYASEAMVTPWPPSEGSPSRKDATCG